VGTEVRRTVPVVRWTCDGRVAPLDGLAALARAGAAPVLGERARVVPRPPCRRRGGVAPGGWRLGSTRRGRRRPRGASGSPPRGPAGGLLSPRTRRDRRHALARRAVLDRGTTGGRRGGRRLVPRPGRAVCGGMDCRDPRQIGILRRTRCVLAPARRPVGPALCVPVVGLGGAAGTTGRRLVPAELVGRTDLAAVSVSLGSVAPPSRRRRSSRAQCLSSNNIPAGASGSKLAATTYCGGRATLPGQQARRDITAGSATTASSSGPTPTRRP
jgi:hypothetical protein